MGWKSLDELVGRIDEYDGAIEDIPAEFDVHGDYLINGASSADIAAGYRDFRDLIKRINGDIIASPEDFGLVAPDKKGNPKVVEATFYPFLWVFTALAASGELAGDVLSVRGEEFVSYAGEKALGSHDAYPRNLEVVMAKLADYGFALEGYRFGAAEDFIVRADSGLLTAICAAVMTPSRFKNMLSDYALFNCAIFKYGLKEKLAFEDTHIAKNSPDYVVEYVTAAIREFAAIGQGIGAQRHHSHYEGWMRFKYFQIYYGVNKLHTIFEAKNLHEHKEYVEALAEKYCNIFRDGGKCRGCRNGECDRRWVGEMFGVRAAWCTTSAYHGFNEAADLAVVVEIIGEIYPGKRGRKR